MDIFRSFSIELHDMATPTRLWKLLWDFDPNGLLVLDERLSITLVNPALCRMLKLEADGLLGRSAGEVLGDVSDFSRAYAERKEIVGQECCIRSSISTRAK